MFDFIPRLASDPKPAQHDVMTCPASLPDLAMLAMRPETAPVNVVTLD
ncbi:MAG: hypothetical protein AAGD13_08705 [Pseudomonadota bacterium]